MAPNTNMCYSNHDLSVYVCRSCDNRSFSNLQNLLNHCRNAQKHRDEWCERCTRLFGSPAARDAHIANSSSHHVCDACSLDYSTPNGLREHDIQVHHMCTDCGQMHGSAAHLKQHHVQVHHLCARCEQRFKSANDLQQHKRTHLPANLKCLGCPRLFSEFSAMVIHLESGNCASGASVRDIWEWVEDADLRDKYTMDDVWVEQYRCPTCDAPFRFASGLLQHVGTRACRQNPKQTIAEFRNVLSQRV